jgi:hypothetical protein
MTWSRSASFTDDIARVAGFYERATSVQASRPNENFAELATATLAIARTVPVLAPVPPGRTTTARSSSSSSSAQWRFKLSCAGRGARRPGRPRNDRRRRPAVPQRIGHYA